MYNEGYPTNEELQEYFALGLDEKDAYLFWRGGLSASTVAWITNPIKFAIDTMATSPVYKIPLSAKKEIPSPKRRKGRLQL